MFKYVKVFDRNDSFIQVDQARGWEVVGEIVTPDGLFVKLRNSDPEYAKRLLELNTPKE